MTPAWRAVLLRLEDSRLVDMEAGVAFEPPSPRPSEPLEPGRVPSFRTTYKHKHNSNPRTPHGCSFSAPPRELQHQMVVDTSSPRVNGDTILITPC